MSGDRRALAELATTVAAAARRAGIAPPDAYRGFTPHLTLARCRAPVDVREIVACLDRYRGPGWTVRGDLPDPQHARPAAAVRDAGNLAAALRRLRTV